MPDLKKCRFLLAGIYCISRCRFRKKSGKRSSSISVFHTSIISLERKTCSFKSPSSVEKEGEMNQCLPLEGKALGTRLWCACRSCADRGVFEILLRSPSCQRVSVKCWLRVAVDFSSIWFSVPCFGYGKTIGSDHDPESAFYWRPLPSAPCRRQLWKATSIWMKVFVAFITECFKIKDFVSLTLTSVHAKGNILFLPFKDWV